MIPTNHFAVPEGLKVAMKLVEWCDVMTESFPAGVLDKYGLDYQSVSKIKPNAAPYFAYNDFVAGHYSQSMLAAAVFHWQRTGEGQHVDLWLRQRVRVPRAAQVVR